MLWYYADGNLLLMLIFSASIVGSVFLAAISLFAVFAIWWERKTAGHIQSRVGPMHVGAWHGWAQSFADGIKLILKEDLIPRGADHLLFRLAPYLAFVPVLIAFMVLPFGPQLTFESGLNIGILYLLAILSIEVMGTILAGWGSNSKWSVYGAMREACQMVSYEVPLGIAIITGLLVAGTLNLAELGYLQGGGIHTWLAFHNPFVFLAFFVYFIASLASNKRAPFDLPESESELVAGFLTEYSGIRWALFFFGEYTAMLIIGCIQAALFLGGWNSPLGPYDPVYMLLGYDPVQAGSFFFSGGVDAAARNGGWAGVAQLFDMATWQLIALNLYCLFWFLLKAIGIVFLQIWLRWTLPRIRIDQVMHLCVKVLLPASLVLLLGCAAWIALVPQPTAAAAQMIEVTREQGSLAFQTAEASDPIARLGHLLSPTPWLQAGTQWLLAGLFVLLLGTALLIVAYAWLSASGRWKGHPTKSLFDSAMPVSRTIAFKRSTDA